MNNEASHPSNSLPSLQKVLIVGGGGRENALAWAIAKHKKVEAVYVAPGNGGTKKQSSCHQLAIEESNDEELLKTCISLKIDLVVIGGEKPLASGLADKFRDAGLVVFGPGKNGAQLEASKKWAKDLMAEAGIPTARYWAANNKPEALDVLAKINQPLVVKADGLASGKGVRVCQSIQETREAIEEAFAGKFGEAGTTLVLEECLEGPEVSVFAISDGENLTILPTAQDHKRLLEGDKGPNTGGMGAYAPAKVLNSEGMDHIKETILKPTLEALNKRNINYRGVIYAGLMLTNDGPKVIEYNCRFGDPECQALMPLLGPELAQLLQAAALGSLKKAPFLKISPLMSACVVATTSGYPHNPKKGDLVSIQLDEKKDFPIQLFHSGTKLSKEGNLITSGGRVLSIVAQGANYNDAFNLVYEAIKEVNFDGINYRKDIGHQIRNIDSIY
ncbi:MULTISPECIES: phosphoribosylamine--glycine ligase [Prochlorococcus]|uniref:Phosphoribosylamine--glycine ligase n=1 Tax=Prochlorococcus marinus (strain SARG / CCMP1375 / SS120) TaxID=167539 RepID=Q7VAN7_PROMA|nr:MULTISPECIES: phosphoribosylamine--glycine ligase [Prochlorococcus]AAQ00465.1 Phosphoribosylamine-glycine ligase [Prochlorococcus marinus subsp. marinus str. CCMP1375]KGG14346.1 Phosphoribosylamine--glycine ligase [Prochlorococcus marinus str. LG]KGG22080.1 Phosphoribosylamine--glycine ligase [Prochlorococcus marinus str. SS2]KGG24602.1 Phosphoribosylamine--glycine ligase [Prochlorococcus marinus str. SS35]KGG33495.1 Phosphoribosylamine--glycine ligase [Prochlorococcus marinus str. SS51]